MSSSNTAAGGGGPHLASSIGAKITHVKTSTIESPHNTVSMSSSSPIFSGVSTAATVKVASTAFSLTSMGTTPVQQPQTSTTTLRAIAAGSQSNQVKVMPSSIPVAGLISQQMIATGRTQITAIPAAAVAARTATSSAIALTRPTTQTTYMPRTATVSATQIASVGGVSTAQRFVTPIRTTTATGGAVVNTAAVTGLTTAVISPAASGTWMANSTGGQVQLIRAISQQARPRIITTPQGSVSGTVISAAGNMPSNHSTIQIVTSNAGIVQQQQTGIASLATVLPARQQQQTNTLVYSQSQQSPVSVASAAQRIAVATPLNTAPRQIRQIPFGKSFATTKLNSTSISIRAPPNMPQLAQSVAAGTGVGVGAVVASTSNTSAARYNATAANVIPAGNLSTTTTRIIQLQPSNSGATQQIIGPTSRLAANVMLQPIIVNASAAKIGIRQPVALATKQPSITITQLSMAKSAAVNVPASQAAIASSSSAASSTAGTQLSSSAAQNIIASTSTPAAIMPLTISNATQRTVTNLGAGKKLLTSVATEVNATNATTIAASGTPTASVLIHQATTLARSVSNNQPVSSASTSVNTQAQSTATAAAAFLPAGSTIFYESMPAASSMQVSTGVLSLTTTTSTSSSGSSLAISSLPLGTHAVSSAATLTVMPSSASSTTASTVSGINVARSIGQLQLPVSTGTNTHVQFSTANMTQANTNNTSQLLIPATYQSSTSAATVSFTAAQQLPIVNSLPTTAKRKRDVEGNHIITQAAKNLAPTLLAMSSPASSHGSTNSLLTTENVSKNEQLTLTMSAKHLPRSQTPDSFDGSTTVSANSSPDVDRQMQHSNFAQRMPVTNTETNFKQSNEIYSNAYIAMPSQQANETSTAAAAATEDEPTSSKVPRLANAAQTASALTSTAESFETTSSATESQIAAPVTTGNKENSVPKTQYIIRRPRKCTLLQSYKHSWKSVNNHFQRYSDVKPRVEQRPNVIELANQSTIMNKIYGWKVHHLRATMEDLIENETAGYDELKNKLAQFESHEETHTDFERIRELMKGNLQRNKIIVDGLTDVQNQIMKIFDHKPHVADIIQRCASKRNIKKREKI